MSPRPGPVFLERRSYRQRRMNDAARVLPMLGIILLGVPLLWPTGAGYMQGVGAQGIGGQGVGGQGLSGQGAVVDGMPTSHAMIYIFGVWALLALASAVLVTRLSDVTVDDPDALFKSTEAKPAEAKPAEAKPAEAKPTEAKSVGSKPGHSEPDDPKPADVQMRPPPAPPPDAGPR